MRCMSSTTLGARCVPESDAMWVITLSLGPGGCDLEFM
jgi:hypothetical protein